MCVCLTMLAQPGSMPPDLHNFPLKTFAFSQEAEETQIFLYSIDSKLNCYHYTG